MNTSSFTLQIPKALPSLSLSKPKTPHQIIISQHKSTINTKLHKILSRVCLKDKNGYFNFNKSSLAIQIGALLATVEQPALAITGVNSEPDLYNILIQSGILAFWYFIIMPPIIMNWLRIRWYRRNLLEMYLQFMFVFMFFPGVLIWAPFLNFRKFPRDPSMEYPWDTPKEPSQIKNDYLKYPFAQPEDYDNL